MPGNHILTVIAFLILYSEKMQEVNVRSGNSACADVKNKDEDVQMQMLE